MKYQKSLQHPRFSELSMNCTYSFLLYSFFYFMRSIQKTLIQFARHGKLKQFSRLLHSPRCQANYDLSCNSVCSPRCSSWNYNRKVVCKKRFCWVDCLGRFETNCLLVTRFHRLCSWPTAIHSWKLVGLMERLCSETPERTLSFPRFLMKMFAIYLPKILTDMTSKSVTYRLRYLTIWQRRLA